MGINYGVIVGRFQVNSLHPGHLELFRQVSERHDRVIVFIGVSRTVPTKRNPLDFETRKKMIQAEYPDFTILPLRDDTDQQPGDILETIFENGRIEKEYSLSEIRKRIASYDTF